MTSLPGEVFLFVFYNADCGSPSQAISHHHSTPRHLVLSVDTFDGHPEGGVNATTKQSTEVKGAVTTPSTAPTVNVLAPNVSGAKTEQDE